MLFTSKMTDVYYSMILAWCVFYLCNGFTSTLPWSTCTEEYNTNDCYSQTFQVGVTSYHLQGSAKKWAQSCEKF